MVFPTNYMSQSKTLPSIMLIILIHSDFNRYKKRMSFGETRSVSVPISPNGKDFHR